MRAHGNEGRLGRRFAIVICVAAVGVMAFGAQTAAAKTYNTRLTIVQEANFFFGHVLAGGKKLAGGRKTCEDRRLVTLFKQRPGADRKLRADRSDPRFDKHGAWIVRVHAKDIPRDRGVRVYATVSREVGDGFVCSGDRSPIWTVL